MTRRVLGDVTQRVCVGFEGVTFLPMSPRVLVFNFVRDVTFSSNVPSSIPLNEDFPAYASATILSPAAFSVPLQIASDTFEQPIYTH